MGKYKPNTVLMHVLRFDRKKFRRFANGKGYSVPEMFTIVVDKLDDLGIVEKKSEDEEGINHDS